MVLRRLLAVLFVPVLALAGCGDDSDTLTDPDPTEAPSDGADGDGSGDDPAGGDEPSGDGSDNGDGTAAPSGDRCEEVIDWMTGAGMAFGPEMFESGESPDDLESNLEQSVQYLERLADTAPSEIQADFAVVAEFFGQYAQALAEVDYDFSRLMTDPDAMQAFEALDDPAFEEASENIDAWFTANCDPEDLDLDDMDLDDMDLDDMDLDDMDLDDMDPDDMDPDGS